MRCFSAILCSVIATLVAGEYTVEDNVLVLTKDNFDQAVGEFKTALLVEFCKSHVRHMVHAAECGVVTFRSSIQASLNNISWQ